METLRKLIDAECDYHMADGTMDRFLALMTEVHLKNKEPMIPYGKVDSNIYIVKEGIIRHAYFDGLKEKTLAFSIPGVMLFSYHSYYKGAPSFYQLESCCKSVVMKVSKAKFDELIEQSEDFSHWVLRMSILQLYAWEMKSAIINGTAKERFEALVKNRPEILQRVSNKIIASYIGISQPYLNVLKRELMPNFRK